MNPAKDCIVPEPVHKTVLLFVLPTILAAVLLAGCFDPVGKFDNPVDPEYGGSLSRGSLVMQGSAMGEQIGVETTDATVEEWVLDAEGFRGMEIRSPDDRHDIEFRQFSALAGAGTYDIETELNEMLGVGSIHFETHLGSGNLPAESGSLTLTRMDRERWVGTYRYISTNDDLWTYDVEGSFDVSVSHIDIPDSAFQ